MRAAARWADPAVSGAAASLAAAAADKPNIILCMTDDQGWGDTGYNGHPHLKTPNLDAMAANGLRFDRFYAGAPVCSPTEIIWHTIGGKTLVSASGALIVLPSSTLRRVAMIASSTIAPSPIRTRAKRMEWLTPPPVMTVPAASIELTNTPSVTEAPGTVRAGGYCP